MLEASAHVLVFAVLMAATFVPLELVFGDERPGWRRPGLATDVAFATLGQLAVVAGLLIPVASVLDLASGIDLAAPLLREVPSPAARTAVKTALGLLVFETIGYAMHRLAHAWPPLWRLHRVHHSAEVLDWAASFRQHPAEIVLVALVQNLALVILGLPFAAHAAVLMLLRINTVFVHSNLRLPRGPWEMWIATPRFHHRHHARTGSVRNFSAMFPWLDRLFGTHCPKSAPEVGLPTPSRSGFLALLGLRS